MAEVIGTAWSDFLIGTDGDDTIDGKAGADWLHGGLGDDTYIFDNVGDMVVEYGGVDTIQSTISIVLSLVLNGDVENVTLLGSSSIDATGNALDNVLTGNTGDNFLNGAAGADTMAGGLGNDTYSVDSVGDVVTEAADAGIDTVRSWIGYALGDNLENLTLVGSANISATGNALNNVLIGNAGDNFLNGGAGADTMAGGLGNDTYSVDSVGDVVTEAANAGTDTVRSWIGYTLGDNLENLTLVGSADIGATGNALNNVLTGNAGDNFLNGGAGADTMAGGLGKDTYSVDAVGDVVTEAANAGTDTVRSWISYTLGDNVENLALVGSAAINGTGNASKNLLVGNGGANILDGGLGTDTLQGLAGNDTIIGGAGDDRIDLSGGGNDTVRYTGTLDGHDLILGFDGNPSDGQDLLALDELFDSLAIATADRAARVTLSAGAGTVDVHVDVSALGNGGNVITIATIDTADAIIVGQDVLVGTL